MCSIPDKRSASLILATVDERDNVVCRSHLLNVDCAASNSIGDSIPLSVRAGCRLETRWVPRGGADDRGSISGGQLIVRTSGLTLCPNELVSSSSTIRLHLGVINWSYHRRRQPQKRFSQSERVREEQNKRNEPNHSSQRVHHLLLLPFGATTTVQVKLSRDLSRGTGIEVCGCVCSPVQWIRSDKGSRGSQRDRSINVI